ncbi:unnamed protein product [Parascedosporium putredinis]|uniref:Major facilitator superfamily (MFS) profile domain-containing protein n=1 Tax=Parascedosporium putredinis TaxID=1442378 RepID=A0A9P1MDT4_9PEZI|nr:unnamed protein product [Parascedosporium putredinis]CAI8004276.1 unnamed protein product [Parascedosporium putredinis]
MALLVKILRAVIRNEAMKEDPDQIYNWRVFALVFSSCFGGMLFGWDTGAISGVLAMDGTKKKFGYFDKSKAETSLMEQNIVSTLQAGCFFACFLTGWLTEKYGRRWMLIGTGAFTTVGVIFQTASAIHGDIAVMYVGRFLAGMGVGAASTLTPLYVSECAPRAIRGALTTFYQLFIVTGIMISYWVNYGCLLHVSAPAIYMVPLALQATPAMKDDWERATSIISRLRNLPADHDYVRTELQDMAQQLEHERQLTGDATAKTLMKEMIQIPGNRKRALITVALMVCQQMTGTNAINYYAPQIFKNLGMTGTDTGLFATGVYGIVKFTGCFLFLVFVVDSLGRRRSLLWTSIAQGLVMYLIGIYGRTQPPLRDNPFFQFGWGPVCWILVSEIPTAPVLTMQNTMGKAGFGMFFMFGSFDLLMFIFVWFFIPETKGISLEKMDELFGVVEANRKMADEDAEARPASIHNAPEKK